MADPGAALNVNNWPSLLAAYLFGRTPALENQAQSMPQAPAQTATPSLGSALQSMWQNPPPGGLINMIKSAVTLPGDVATGNVQVMGPDGHTNPEVIHRAVDLAGFATGGSFAAPAERNAVGAGVRAYQGANAGEGITGYHWSPAEFSQFGAGTPWMEGTTGYMGNGIYLARSPQNAGLYRDLAKSTGATQGEGHMYKVKVTAPPDRIVDLEKPFNEQPEFVQKALAPLIEGKKSFEAFGVKFTPETTPIRDLASDFITQQNLAPGVTPHISDIVPWMQQRGIAGIRHDATVNIEGGFTGTPSEGDLVIFNPSHVQIVGRQSGGLPIPPVTPPMFGK